LSLSKGSTATLRLKRFGGEVQIVKSWDRNREVKKTVNVIVARVRGGEKGRQRDPRDHGGITIPP